MASNRSGVRRRRKRLLVYLIFFWCPPCGQPELLNLDLIDLRQVCPVRSHVLRDGIDDNPLGGEDGRLAALVDRQLHAPVKDDLHGFLVHGLTGFLIGGLAYGGVMPTNSAIISDFFGRTNYPVNYSLINTNLIIASFASTIAGKLYDASQSYMAPVMMMIGVTVVGFIVSLGIRRPKAK